MAELHRRVLGLPHRTWLNRVAMEVAEERAQRFVGDTLSVLVEGPNPKVDGQVMGRTEGNKIAFFVFPSIFWRVFLI